MPVFKSTEMMYEVLGRLWEELLSEKELADKFKEAGIIIKFTIHDPKGEIWLFPQGKVVCGHTEEKPTVEMFLSGDDCHRFWMQELKLPVALATRKIKAKGPINKILKLLPLIRPAYERYPSIASKYNIL